VNLCAACGEWRRLQSVKKFVVSRTEIPTASIDTHHAVPKFERTLARGCPTFPAFFAGGWGSWKGQAAGSCQFRVTILSWPLNCCATINCRRARVTLPAMPYLLSDVGAPNWDSYGLWAQAEPVAQPHYLSPIDGLKARTTPHRCGPLFRPPVPIESAA
jgi:hypothetical protein